MVGFQNGLFYMHFLLSKILHQLVLMVPFELVESQLPKAEWRSASVECGEQCAMIAGTSEMPELYADSWGCLTQVH